LIKAQVESSGTFGAQFREAAARALLLPKSLGRLREPLWRRRRLAKKLLASVSPSGDFPLVLEALRATYLEALDVDGLLAKLAELGQGTVTVSKCRTSSPSPQASSAVWQEINQLM
jgi:ATP-dependent Lhr-like helicase